MYVYRDYGIAFDIAGSWSVGNEFAMNALIFGVDNSSLTDKDNPQGNVLALREGPTDDIDGSFSAVEQNFSNNLKQKQNFA